jgi:uncharacterized membrane protein
VSHAKFIEFIGERAGGVGVAAVIIFSFAYNLLVIKPIAYGVSFAHLQAARDDPLEFRDMFEAFYTYWTAVLASLLVSVIVGIGIVLLIVPGIIFACKLAFTPYLVVDRQMTVIEAVQQSWRMTSGHAWRVFLVGLLAIPLALVGLMFCGVGIIIALMWTRLAFASLYHAISSSGRTPVHAGVT